MAKEVKNMCEKQPIHTGLARMEERKVEAMNGNHQPQVEHTTDPNAVVRVKFRGEKGYDVPVTRYIQTRYDVFGA